MMLGGRHDALHYMEQVLFPMALRIVLVGVLAVQEFSYVVRHTRETFLMKHITFGVRASAKRC